MSKEKRKRDEDQDGLNQQRDENNTNGGGDNMPRFNFTWIYILIGLALLGLQLSKMFVEPPVKKWPDFEDMAMAGDVEKLTIVNLETGRAYIKKDSLYKYFELFKIEDKNGDHVPDKQGWGFNPDQLHIEFKIGDMDQLRHNLAALNDRLAKAGKAPIEPDDFIEETNWTGTVVTYLIPLLLLLALWIFILRRMGGGGAGPGAQIFNIGKSKATLFDNNARVNITFADVAGLDEAKEEVIEIVDFLKNPKKYTSLGGKIPKGVLLVGPPGTGKTLLAKAVAGEAGVPFFSISGSDFVEMFVGVGASRVRDLFRQAREKAPCIIFIDEIDAIGRARGRGAIQGGNDERENTLNQLLVEMDGFSTDKGVILLAATNRPDILDHALMRPGRFDRQIGIGRPDLQGREQIFQVHLKNIKVSPEVTPKALAEMTPGFVGADIANVCNEAALIAARRDKKAVDLEDFNYALDKVIGGLEKKNKIISPEEKQIIAYHEAGHAICGWFLEHAHPLVKVTIVPRGLAALGYAQYLPKEQYITRKDKLLDDICMTLGGRAAESVVFDKISTGAQSDLDHITRLCYDMIVNYGMNEKVGNISFVTMMGESYQRPFSEQTAYLIDQEVKAMIDEQYDRAKNLLREKRKELDTLAKTLLEKEVLLRNDLENLIGKRPFADPTPGESASVPEVEPPTSPEDED
ncbi:MAG: ATP-dependent zinc metalloprotease FtsH [Lewinellaceae bacterium]|nr:ATP-dependent zinc metalloprotease FtsH [Lewinellaceae bacterium]MCB9333306.1 ATP-dependent zinc metalloprotease FtsH [Lewinellaceae bacterium]